MLKLKELLERYRNWKQKRAWLKYQDWRSIQLGMAYLELQLMDLKRDFKRKKELQKLWKKIQKKNSEKDYIV